MAHRFKNLKQYLNIKDVEKLPHRVKSALNRISAMMDVQQIDGETAVALMQSFEEQNGNNFNLQSRLFQFQTYLSRFEDKTDLLNTVNDLGLLSTDALEERCRETDDWMPYMVRREVLKKASDKKESEYKGKEKEAQVE